MFTFKDTEGRSWDLSLTIGDVKRVKNLVGVDLLDARQGQLLSDLASDPVATVDVLYAIVKPEADARNVSDEQFGAALDGESVRKAIDAFVEALIDFFARFQPATGAVLRALWGKLETTQAKAIAIAEEKLGSAKVDQAIEAELARASREADEAIDKLLGGRSTD